MSNTKKNKEKVKTTGDVTSKKNHLNKKSEGSGGDKVTRYIVIGMIALVLIAGVAATLAKKGSSSGASLPAQAAKSDGYGISFNKSSKVKVDLFEDFRCPVCRDFEAANDQYISGLVKSGKINAVYHPMHFIAPDSQLAANAAACAADQGKFLEMHTALYVKQPTTAQSSENSSYWNSTSLIQLGRDAGIASPLFDSCVTSGKYLNWTGDINNDASKKNINSTPTLLVNGKKVAQATVLDNKALTKLLATLGVK